MGYSCPVCGDPQADGVHLANHLAFTSMVRGGGHEAWLDEHVPKWSAMGEEELAAEVTEDAEETEYPQVFEDTTGGEHSHSHAQDGEPQHSHETDETNDSLPPGTTVPDSPRDEETAEILQEAQELTRERREGSESSENGGQEAASDDSETE